MCCGEFGLAPTMRVAAWFVMSLASEWVDSFGWGTGCFALWVLGRHLVGEDRLPSRCCVTRPTWSNFGGGVVPPVLVISATREVICTEALVTVFGPAQIGSTSPAKISQDT